MRPDFGSGEICRKPTGYLSFDEIPSDAINKWLTESRMSKRDVGKFIRFDIPMKSEYLKIELQAAGLKVDGSLIQKHFLHGRQTGYGVMNYYWNCSFPNSGIHDIRFIIRSRSISSQPIDIGTFTHSILVAQVDHLTYNQIYLITLIIGLIGGILSLIMLIEKLQQWSMFHTT